VASRRAAQIPAPPIAERSSVRLGRSDIGKATMAINNQDLTGKVAFVTGAVLGMGFAAAQAFPAAGASVALADRDEPKLRAATQKLTATGHKVIGIACDMSNDAHVAATVDRAVAEFGRLDAAYNNAGANSGEVLLGDLTDDEWQRILSINLRSVWVCMRAELRVMLIVAQGSPSKWARASAPFHEEVRAFRLKTWMNPSHDWLVLRVLRLKTRGGR
jgi:hypothetical protein